MNVTNKLQPTGAAQLVFPPRRVSARICVPYFKSLPNP
jgi:hypothetical protein